MDGARFDTWTRRRLSLAVGGAGLLALLRELAIPDVEADKKKKRKKRQCAKKAGERCSQKTPCCNGKGLECLPEISNPGGATRCCKVGLQACSTNDECCGKSCVDGACSCKTEGQECGGIGTICC